MNPDMNVMTEMVNNNECLKIEDGIATIRPSVIRDRLNGKLSQDDCNTGHSAMLDAIRLQSLQINLCASCRDTECALASCSIPRCRPRGTKDAKVMFVNKMPSMYETATGVSFSDEKGIMLSVILSKMKVNMADVYYTDFVKCVNSTMTTEDISLCAKTYILNEVITVRPSIIIGNGLGVLRGLQSTGVIYGLPENIQYGTIYSATACNGHQLNVMGMYDIERVLMKEGDELMKCKGQLWQQLCAAFDSIKKEG